MAVAAVQLLLHEIGNVRAHGRVEPHAAGIRRQHRHFDGRRLFHDARQSVGSRRRFGLLLSSAACCCRIFLLLFARLLVGAGSVGSASGLANRRSGRQLAEDFVRKVVVAA